MFHLSLDSAAIFVRYASRLLKSPSSFIFISMGHALSSASYASTRGIKDGNEQHPKTSSASFLTHSPLFLIVIAFDVAFPQHARQVILCPVPRFFSLCGSDASHTNNWLQCATRKSQPPLRSDDAYRPHWRGRHKHRFGRGRAELYMRLHRNVHVREYAIHFVMTEYMLIIILALSEQSLSS